MSDPHRQPDPTHTDPAGGDPEQLLTEDELRALTETILKGGATPTVDMPAGGASGADVRPYDLLASRAQVVDSPALDLIHQSFCRGAEAALGRMTRGHVELTVLKPQRVPFSELFASLPNPHGVLITRWEGLGAKGLCLLDPPLVFHVLDRLLGGPGGGRGATDTLAKRTFTAAERRLLGRVVATLSGPLEAAWRDVAPVGLSLVKAETDRRHAALAGAGPGDDMMVFSARLQWSEELTGTLTLALPAAALNPLAPALGGEAAPDAPPDPTWRARLRQLVADAPLEITAVLGRRSLALREVASWRPGTLLPLTSDPEERVELLVDGVPRFTVRPEVAHGGIVLAPAGPPPSAHATPGDRS